MSPNVMHGASSDYKLFIFFSRFWLHLIKQIAEKHAFFLDFKFHTNVYCSRSFQLYLSHVHLKTFTDLISAAAVAL